MTAHFEGSEKALEVTLAPGQPSLRSRAVSFFEELVAVADGTVLRRTVTPQVDAYLLAESSLFVADAHLLMLTCGRTRVYRAAESLIGALGAEAFTSLSLTRLGERFPDEQLTALEDDVRALSALLPGHLVRLGTRGPHAGGAFVFETDRAREPGETRLRIVGNDLDAAVAARFTGADRSAQTKTLAPVLGTFGDATLDPFDFAPSGFSLNAVRGHATWAVHVTPEPASSYVSVVASHEDPALVLRTLEVFAPRTCLVTSESEVALPPAYRVTGASSARIGARTVHVVEAELQA